MTQVINCCQAGHFRDLASPFLWQWMLVYGGIIIVGAELAWFTGLKKARTVDASLATSSTMLAGVLAAFLLLGERPVPAQYIGGAVVLLGIAIGLLGERFSRRGEAPERLAARDTVEFVRNAERGIGFKGI